MRSLLEIQNILVRDNIHAYGGTRSQMINDFRHKFNYSFNDRLSLEVINDDKYLKACYDLGYNGVIGWYSFNNHLYSEMEKWVRSFYIPYNSFDINLNAERISDCGTAYFLGYTNAIKKLTDQGLIK